jgi:hypothetical protein
MDNPNYKFGKSFLTDGDLKKAAPFTRKLHKFYMQCGKSDDDSHIMVALRPDSSVWRPRWSNGLQQLLTQKVHLAPNTQQAEQAGFARAKSNGDVRVNFS